MPSLARLVPPRSERGAVFLEFAVVLPLLLSIVLGIFTGGMAYTSKIGVVEAVREGARYGASMPVGTGPGALDAWKLNVKNRVIEASGGEIAAADVCVALETISRPEPGCGLADPPGASNEPAVQLVKVTAKKTSKVEFFFFTKPLELKGHLVARYERDTG